MSIDFFISHSKETKAKIAIPITQALSALGFNVWIDRNGIVTGQHIYHKIKNAICDSIYCIAIIDHEFLTRSWPLEEIRLFHLKEVENESTVILPIYVDIDKENVYKIIPWLEGRAFEKIDTKHVTNNVRMEILCRIAGRYYRDYINNKQIVTLQYSWIRNYSFPCKETLFSLLESKQYFSLDFRLSIIEICNLTGVISAIYNALITDSNKYINISVNFSSILRNFCFDIKYIPTYNMYISALYMLQAILEELKILLNSG